MKKEKKQDDRYQATVGEGRKVLRLLIYLLIIAAVAFAGKMTYDFGYAVFYQQPMTSEVRAQEVKITVQEDMSVYQIGKLLESKGLIDNAVIFVVQEKLSDYSGQIRTGQHTLSTAQTPDEMLAVMTASPEEEEE